MNITPEMNIIPEFSRPILVEQLGTGLKTFKLQADPAECEALAKRFDIVALKSLMAVVQLKVLAGGDLVRLHGQFNAHVIQACVVTLEPVESHLDEAFDLVYGPPPDNDEGDEIVIDMAADDPPEPIVGGAIDIGEAVAEHLALALPPFPRAAGAEFVAVEEPERPNPFAALEALKKK